MQKMKSVPNNHIEQLTQPEFQCMEIFVCGRLVAFSSTWSFARTMENWIYFPFSQIPAVHRLQTIDWKKERNFNFIQFQINHNRWNCLGSLFQKYFFSICGWKTNRYGHRSPVYRIKIHWFARPRQENPLLNLSSKFVLFSIVPMWVVQFLFHFVGYIANPSETKECLPCNLININCGNRTHAHTHTHTSTLIFQKRCFEISLLMQ